MLPQSDAAERGRQLAFHVIALFAITPFGVLMTWQGPRVNGLVTLAGCAAILVSALLIWRQRALAFAQVLACGVPSLAVLYFVNTLSLFGMMWSYPMVVFFYLYLELNLAIFFNTVFIIALAVVAMSLELPVYARFLVTHLVIGCMAILFARTIARQQAELKKAADTDSLTGLANRRALQQSLDSWQRQRTRYGIPVTLMLIDLDHFKNVNDQLGHQAGDQLLVQVAGVLRQRQRDTDLVGRWGGEEFVMVLPHTQASEALVLADNLSARIAALTESKSPPVTASIGMADLQANEDADAWLARADAALYQAKAAGRNRVVVAAAGPTG